MTTSVTINQPMALDDDPQAVLVELMGAIQKSDEAAFSTFYDQTVGKVYGLVSRMIANHHDVEEVVCDIYTQVWQICAEYRAAKGSVMGWLMVISRSRALDYLRKNARRVAKHEQFEAYSVMSEETDRSLDVVLSAFEENSTVQNVLAELPFIQRQMLALSFFHGLAHQEISDTLDVPLGTVKSHIRRALLCLRDKCEVR